MKKILFPIFLLIFSSQTLASKRCEPLKIGQSKRVNIGKTFSKTRVIHKYSLKRISEHNYEIYFNMIFKHIKNADVSKDTIRNITEKTEACFERYSPQMTDGLERNITLKLYNKEQHRKTVKKPPRVFIEIKDVGYRSDSHHYATDMRCRDILHEVFHLAGLVDEYEESWLELNDNLFKRIFTDYFEPAGKGSGLAMNCRHTGPDDSIMANPDAIYSYDKVLRSGHIDAILYPNCKKMNKEYYSCAKNAYRTSKDHGGVLGCRKTPESCDNENWIGI